MENATRWEWVLAPRRVRHMLLRELMKNDTVTLPAEAD
jgi:hypothetical protein